MDGRRSYDEEEVGLWFAFSALADAAALYEQIVRASGNVPGVVSAGTALVDSARDVDAAVRPVQLPRPLQRTWDAVRAEIGVLDPEYVSR